ncbi:MAG: 2-C-methyl-D-erythritol 4-phosphate cytidylyltransferase [Candidatus Bipolaricaulota bacterium]|nr:2-C-methyl-D-erythritol 4-phosphate cytidylyltransferase [Candidatus Bipolaricaulota bacterium]MDW8152245.1 2-C-methyl-D-erythritol 4-phosphate cytidylyltransferase [Candidatus Bipolaricaulota bacterium]
MRASGILLAAGKAERFGQDKVFLELGGVPVLVRAARAFQEAGAVEELVAVVRPGAELRAAALLQDLEIPVRVVTGGPRRRDSSLAGVEAARGEIVLIHDAARPLVSPELIRRVLVAAEKHGAAVPVLPVVDTLRYAENDFLKPEVLPRAGLVAIQTPQGFRRELLLSALQECDEDLPDDAAALLSRGIPVATVPGDLKNLKLTYPEDLLFAASLLQVENSW